MSEATSENEKRKGNNNVEPISPEAEATNKEEATIIDCSDGSSEAKQDASTDGNFAETEEKLKEAKPVEEDFKEKYYYLAAEMENLRKRFDREKQNLLKYGSEKILSGLLEVVDNLDRTADAISSDEDEKIKNILTGISMVKKQFIDVLKSNGLKQVESVGHKFDPNIHEAMAGQPAEGKENDEIINEFQKGYTLNGRLLRAAKVIIVNND
jgi:molecular chaperone GrpE